MWSSLCTICVSNCIKSICLRPPLAIYKIKLYIFESIRVLEASAASESDFPGSLMLIGHILSVTRRHAFAISMASATSTIPDLDFFYCRPGLKLKNGRYEVLRKLGSGVYSLTYLVSDSTPKPESASKSPKPSRTRSSFCIP
jgi:hypothetical protein